ncbi:MAG: DEAD/DEAH box helicase [Fusobacteria bacterium]|nr:DEAD/DEAH box helicase [Fusobacteriota bacterium]
MELYSHQREALFHLEKMAFASQVCKGLLVLPTGSGKTVTAMVFLEKLVKQNPKIKILWLAHRHELLEQAFSTYEHIFGNTNGVHIVSGIHAHIESVDRSIKCIIASKDSLIRSLSTLGSILEKNQNKWVCIVDEAHHAGARTYRELLNFIESYNRRKFTLIGLTATPYRTAAKEAGLLKKVFPHDILYSTDMKHLVAKGILAEPVFHEVETAIQIEQTLSKEELAHLYSIDTIPKAIIEHLSGNFIRNQRIIDFFVENQVKFNKTLLFAFNQIHAITLYHMFKSAGVNCDFIISNREQVVEERKKRTNHEVIQAFRNGQIKLLINVEILTEGADFPDVDSIFLTRPTASTILMTQMVGRVLRGVESGGTSIANIVSFIDQWKDKINWVSPRVLIDTEYLENAKEVVQKREYAKQLIIDKKVEEMISVFENQLTESSRDGFSFYEKLPIGAYLFSYLQELEIVVERSAMIMIFEHLELPYSEFIDSLPRIVEKLNLQCQINHEEDEAVIETVIEMFFEGYDLSIGFHRSDIVDLINFYFEKQILPDFIEFDEREKFNVTKLAYFIMDEKMDRRREATYIEQVWGRSEENFKHLFNFQPKRLLLQLNWEIERILHPTWFKVREKRKISQAILEKMPFEELIQRFPYFYKRFENELFKRYRSDEIGYWSESGHFHSFERKDFEILYKTSLELGGATTAINCVIVGKNERESYLQSVEILKEKVKNQTTLSKEVSVKHSKFGQGVVIGIDEKYVRVSFRSVGIKNFPIENVDNYLVKF